MAISNIATTNLNWTSDATGKTLNITKPTGATADDIILVFISIPNIEIFDDTLEFDEHSNHPIITSSDFDALYGGNQLAHSVGFGSIFFRRVLATGEPTAYTLELDYGRFNLNWFDPVNLAIADYDQFAQAHAILIRGVDFYSVIEGKSSAAANVASDPKTGSILLESTKNDSYFIQYSVGITSALTSGNTAAVTDDSGYTNIFSHTFTEAQARVKTTTPDSHKYFAADVSIAGYQSTGKETVTTDYDFTGSDTGLCLVIALIDVNHRLADDPPDPGDPEKVGSGYIGWETDIVKATDKPSIKTEVWSVDGSGDLVMTADVDNSPTFISGTFMYDGLGGCVNALAYFLQEPITAIHNDVFRFKLSETNLTGHKYFWAGIAMNRAFEKSRGVWRLELKGLLARSIDDEVGATPTFPTVTGIFPDSLNLFEGDTVTVTGGTRDIYEPWRSYLKRRFELWPDVIYSVGPDLKYVQGRPRDGGAETLDYSTDSHRARLITDPFPIPNHVTKWWNDDTTLVTGERSILRPLTPRVVVQTSLDGAGSLVVPDGGKVELYTDETNTRFILPALAKPPIKITNLPGLSTQYAVASKVTITNADGSTVGKISSELITGALPYKKRVVE